MTNFAAKLEELLKRKKMRANALARSSGVPQSTISRWINLARPNVSPEDFERVCLALGRDGREHAELLRARLLDLARGPGADRIDILIHGSAPVAMKDEPAAYRTDQLPQDLEDTMQILRKGIVTDAALRQVLTGLARLKSRGTLGK